MQIINKGLQLLQIINFQPLRFVLQLWLQLWAPIAQMDRVTVYETGGCPFESGWAHIC